MLSGPGQFAENETNEVNFREIPSHAACTSLTKSATPTVPPKSPSFRLRQKSPW